MLYYCLQKSKIFQVNLMSKNVTRMLSRVSGVRHNLIGLSCKQHKKIKPRRERQIFKMLIERIYLIQKDRKKGYRLLN